MPGHPLRKRLKPSCPLRAAVYQFAQSPYDAGGRMSRNLIEMLRAREARRAATALEVLKEAIDERGEITDDDRRERGRALRPARGDRLRRLELLRRPAAAARRAPRPRLHRDRLLRARLGDAHVDADARTGSGSRSASAAEDGRSRSPRPSASASATPSPAVREGDVIDAGAGVVERVLAGECAQAAEPEGGSVLDEPVMTRPGDWSGLRARAGGALARGARWPRSRRRTSADAAARASPRA